MVLAEPNPAAARAWAAPLAGGSAALLLSLPLLAFDFWFDQGVFATLADALLAGGTAYRDAWEHKPPGVFYVYAAAFGLLGRDIWAVRTIEILTIGLAGAGLVTAARRHAGSAGIGLTAAALLPLLYLSFAPNTAQPESFQLPCLAWAFAFWPRSADAPKALRDALVSGILLSAAVLFKTPVLLAAVAAVAARLLCDRTRPGWPAKLRLAGRMSAGLAGPVLLMGAWYAVRGAFAPMWDALVAFPAAYAAAAPRPAVGEHLRHAGLWIAGLLSPVELAILAVGLFRLTRRSAGGALVAAGLLSAWMAVAAQGRYFHYHWIPTLPFLCLALAAAFLPAPDLPPKRRLAAAVVLALLAAATLPAQSERLSRAWTLAGRVARIDRLLPLPGVPAPWSESRAVAERIRALTLPHDRIFVWADEALLYFFSDRRMAGPYAHLMPVAAEWRGRKSVDVLLDRFLDAPPRLIVVGPGKLWWRAAIEPKRLLDVYPDMKGMLEDRYRRVETTRGFELWMRTDDDSGPTKESPR